VALNGKIYMMGGWLRYLPSGTLSIYDPQNNSWSQGATIPVPPSNLSGCSVAAAINGRIYLYTHCNGYDGYNDFLFSYDPTTNAWTRLADGPALISANDVGAAIDGKLYVVGGEDKFNGNKASNRLVSYDPVTNQWTTLAPMPTARYGAGAGVIGGKLYVVGGYAGSGATNAVEAYDPRTNQWSTLPTALTPRYFTVADVINGKLYVAGGTDGTRPLSTLEVFDPNGSGQQQADVTLPQVSLTAPLNGATVSKSVAVAASASDNVGVAGVQFKLDGVNLGSEVSSAPYATNWDTTQVSSGAHKLSATARDAAGNTAISTAAVTVSNLPPIPAQPTGLAGAALGTSSITWTWNAVSGAAGYNIYQASSSTVLISSVAAPTFIKTGLSANTTYSIVVAAFNAGGRGPLSASAAASTLSTRPSAPVVRASIKNPNDGKSINGNQVNVMAELVSGSDAQTRSILFQYKPAASSFWIDIPTANANQPNPVLSAPWFTLFDVTPLASGAYNLRAVATDFAGNVDAAPASITVTVDNGPAKIDVPPPTKLAGTALSASSISWTWNAVKGVAGYYIYEAASPTTLIATVTAPSFIMGGLDPSTSYGIIVAGVNYNGMGPLSASATAKTLAAPPAQPTSLAVASVGVSSVTWTWKAVQGATSYNIYKAASPTTLVASVSAPLFFQTGLPADTDCGVVVAAVNAGGKGPLSSSITAHTLPAPDPFKLSDAKITSKKLRVSAVSYSLTISIDRLPNSASVSIVDSKGVLIKTLAVTLHASVWDGIDQQGRRVANGTYYALLAQDQQRRMIKFALKR
jgi:N-acetylneuraminic acid mutarotase